MDMPEMSVEIESSRNATVDYARFVGAIAIVWFHFKMPGAELGYAALPMFLIIQIYYLILNRKRRPLSQAIRFSFFRLLRPWLAWSLIFACLKIGQALIEGHPITDEFFWWMLLSGTEIHLWYLPFSFILGTLTLCVVSQFEDFDRYFIVLLIAFVPCSLISAKLASDPALGNPFTQWSFIFPAGLVGIMAAVSKNPKIDFSLITICSVLVYFISLGFGWQQVCLPLLLGTVSVLNILFSSLDQFITRFWKIIIWDLSCPPYVFEFINAYRFHKWVSLAAVHFNSVSFNRHSQAARRKKIHKELRLRKIFLKPIFKLWGGSNVCCAYVTLVRTAGSFHAK
jgi:hypothetical protein